MSEVRRHLRVTSPAFWTILADLTPAHLVGLCPASRHTPHRLDALPEVAVKNASPIGRHFSLVHIRCTMIEGDQNEGYLRM